MLVLSLNAVIDLNTVSVPDRVLATTALAMSAGYAAADVTLSGDARMGVMNMSRNDNGSAITGGTKTQFTNRARVAFTLSGETDGGLAFGAGLRADNAGDAAKGTAGSVFISGEFGRLSMGDVASGDKAIVGQMGGASSFGNDFNEVTWIGDGAIDGSIDGFALGFEEDGNSDDQDTIVYSGDEVGEAARVLYEYGIDGFNVAASASQLGDDSSYGIGASYEMNGFSIAAGYAAAEKKNLTFDATFGLSADSNNAADATGIPTGAGDGELKATQASVKLGYTFDATTVQALGQSTVVKANSVKVQEVTTYGLSVGTTFHQIGLSAYARQDSTKTNVLNNTVDTNSFGVQASYDLGGGATASIAYNSRQIAGAFDITTASTDPAVPTSVTRDPSTRQNVIEAGLSFKF